MTKILVVDDDSAIRGVISTLLTALGYEVVTAGNGLEAVDVFCADAERIGLVLTDLRMPVMNGYEAVREIWRVKPAVRVVCMSSAEARCPAGATFLAKPFTVVEVRDCIGRALSEPAAPHPMASQVVFGADGV